MESYARDGFTAVIHGKYYHEETKATASQVMKYPGGPLPRGVQHGGGAAGLRLHRAGRRRGGAVAPLRADATRPGSTSPATSSGWASRTRRPCSRASRWRSPRSSGAAWSGATARAAIADHFRTFDTICSATQERQDAVVTLLEEPLDVMVVVGGYNSSNTTHLAALVESKGVRAYHIEDANCVDPVAGTIRHQPVGQKQEVEAAGWLGDVAPHRHHRRRVDAQQQGGRDDRADRGDRRARARTRRAARVVAASRCSPGRSASWPRR